MELIAQYIEQIKVVGGLYVLKVSSAIQKSELDALNRWWKQKYPDKDLLILHHEDGELFYEETFGFEYALALAKSGKKVRRKRWAKGCYIQSISSAKPKLLYCGRLGDNYWVPEEDDLFAMNWEVMKE